MKWVYKQNKIKCKEENCACHVLKNLGTNKMISVNGYMCRVIGYQSDLFDWLVLIDNPICVLKDTVEEHENNDAVEYATNKEGPSKSASQKMGVPSSLSTSL